MYNAKSIVITGASSGIGEQLALAYAAPGMRLAITCLLYTSDAADE